MTSRHYRQGIIDWSKVLPAIKKKRRQKRLSEIEEPYDPSPLGMVKASFDF